MHLPIAAAFAGVDPVDTTAPARNRVAAAAASVAPDLESNFMTISSKIVDTEMRCRRAQNRTAKVRMVFKSRGKPRLLGSSSRSRYGHRAHLVTAVSKESFFFNLDSPVYA